MEKSPEIAKKYRCDVCDYTTSKHSDYSKHLSTGKHIRNESAIKKSPKVATEYRCEICDHVTCNIFDYKKHLSTSKHIGNEISAKSRKKSQSEYTCELCDKSYCDYSGLWRHKKTCNAKSEEEGELKNEMRPLNITTEMFMEIVRHNKEVESIMLEDRKMFMELMSKANQGNTNTNSHNTTNSNNSFNLTLFLNEHCKNALNIHDFVDSLNPSFQDMERTGKVGFVEGITSIFLNGLRQLDVYSRPIHCTDLKRESLYVKDNDIWEKETDDKPRLRKAIKRTANKNLKQIKVWQEQHPDYVDTDTQASEDHIVLAQTLMGGVSQYESEKFENSIMRNILKNVTIDKEELTVR